MRTKKVLSFKVKSIFLPFSKELSVAKSSPESAPLMR